MNRITLAVLGAACVLAACAQPAPAGAVREHAGVAPATAAVPQSQAPAAPQPESPAAQPEPLFLDVRTAPEFAAGHAPGALLIPHDQLPRRLAELEPYRDRPLVVYCRTGHRAAIAYQVLHQAGFRVINGGGLAAMQAAGVHFVAP